MEFEGTKGNEGGDPFGVRSAMQRKMVERGDDPASRARQAAERDADAELSDAEIAELLGPDGSGSDGSDGSDGGGADRRPHTP